MCRVVLSCLGFLSHVFVFCVCASEVLWVTSVICPGLFLVYSALPCIDLFCVSNRSCTIVRSFGCVLCVMRGGLHACTVCPRLCVYSMYLRAETLCTV